MTDPPAFDWAATRGERWLAQLDGMEAMLAPVDAPLLDALRLDAPLRVADVGCGGGATTLAIARRAPSGSAVHGYDIAPGLVEVARARAPQLTFTTADVATTRPAEAPYDRLASRFGVMFFADAPAAFRNLAAWLAPGGRFAFAVWGRARDNPWVTVVRDVVAERVNLPPPVPDTPGPFRYGDVDPLRELLRAAGFAELEVRDWRGPLAIGGGLPAAEAADFALAAFSIAEPMLRAGDEVLTGGRRALTERFARALDGGIVRLNACVHVVTGVRA